MQGKVIEAYLSEKMVFGKNQRKPVNESCRYEEEEHSRLKEWQRSLSQGLR